MERDNIYQEEMSPIGLDLKFMTVFFGCLSPLCGPVGFTVCPVIKKVKGLIPVHQCPCVPELYTELLSQRVEDKHAAAVNI